MTPDHKNQSEVAQLLVQIECEYLAAQRGLSGFAESAKHAIIIAHMEHIERLHEDLRAIVGNGAIQLIAERLASVPDTLADNNVKG